LLSKEGALSEEERTLWEQHPAFGYRIARATPSLHPVAEEIYAFWEHWDGSGYPRGKKGEEIPLITRLVQVVDAYLTLTFSTGGEASLSPQEALEQIEKEKGVRFDPQMVEILKRVIEEK
jgi:HD-GYP domain-containing protein (c-di-GMP phosphodiesterase class II)